MLLILPKRKIIFYNVIIPVTIFTSVVEICVCLVKAQVFLTQLRRGGSLGDSGEGPWDQYVSALGREHLVQVERMLWGAPQRLERETAACPDWAGVRVKISVSEDFTDWTETEEAAGHGNLQSEGKMQD